MRKAVFLTILSVAFASVLWGQNGKAQKMLHIDFKDDRPDGVKLVIALPISVLQSFQPQIRNAFVALQEEHASFDFFEFWRSIKESGPTNFLEVKGKDGHIKISTTESHLVAWIDSPEEGQIKASVPLALGDILFANQEIEDLDGLIEALEGLDGQDLVNISSEFINGRVWIE